MKFLNLFMTCRQKTTAAFRGGTFFVNTYVQSYMRAEIRRKMMDSWSLLHIVLCVITADHFEWTNGDHLGARSWDISFGTVSLIGVIAAIITVVTAIILGCPEWWLCAWCIQYDSLIIATICRRLVTMIMFGCWIVAGDSNAWVVRRSI